MVGSFQAESRLVGTQVSPAIGPQAAALGLSSRTNYFSGLACKQFKNQDSILSATYFKVKLTSDHSSSLLCQTRHSTQRDCACEPIDFSRYLSHFQEYQF